MKKNNTPQPVTKTDLENALKRYATKTDLENALKRYATKVDLEQMADKFNDNIKKYRDDVLTKLDGVMGELQTMREENTIGAYQTRELKEQVDNHEKRITQLETS